MYPKADREFLSTHYSARVQAEFTVPARVPKIGPIVPYKSHAHRSHISTFADCGTTVPRTGQGSAWSRPRSTGLATALPGMLRPLLNEPASLPMTPMRAVVLSPDTNRASSSGH